MGVWEGYLSLIGTLRFLALATHSPAVVSQVPDDSLLLAEVKETVDEGRIFKRVCFSCLSNTWREQAPEKPAIVSKGKLLSYLNPVAIDIEPEDDSQWQPPQTKKRRVIDREDLSLCSFRQQTPIKVPQ
ncbi:hypothetical protein [[Phormidium] sp. ETS-05]|uniref:hypothetical protein n=1 Tax=[Phormidium] sp. ETS-05 TaxID=222819 RepID=UPI0018EF34C9|nr:hypothetical protein [[Phormidium] sp. ETS-05]